VEVIVMTRNTRSSWLGRWVLVLLFALVLSVSMARPMLDPGPSWTPRQAEAEAVAPALPMLVSLVFPRMTYVPIPVHGAPYFTP